jgi:hydroxymethylglutaryl-CoA synthase
MVGIVSYGVYIPRYRLKRKTIFTEMSWFNRATAGLAKGEKAVANYDEDSITMGVAAALNCLNGFERDNLDGIYLASVSMPYANRQNASIVATALDCQPTLRTADFNASLKAGTSALIAAADAVKAGNRTNVLVSATDNRRAKLGGNQEMILGDGAAAFLIGCDNIIAELLDSHTVSYDFPDLRRSALDSFDQGWEDRWIREEGYLKIIPEAVEGIFKKNNFSIKDFKKVIIACYSKNILEAVGKKIGATKEQLQDNLFDEIGDAGAAHALIMLAAALEDANPGDKILVASFGGGCDVMCLEVKKDIKSYKNRGVKWYLENKEELNNYTKYLAFKKLIPIEVGIRGEVVANTSLSLVWRDRKEIYGLCGSMCKNCGTPQYPYQEVCVNPACGAVEQMEYYRFSDKKAKVVSYTGDYLAFSWDPPAIYGFIDFDGGGRFFFDFTDCRLENVQVGMPVEMSFRKRYSDTARAIEGYCWKAVPLKE